MRILLAGYTSMPYIGGVATYMKILYQELKRLGHEVDILVHKPGWRQYYMPTNGRYLIKAKVRNPIRRKLMSLYAKKRLKVHRIIRKYELERYSYEMAAAYFGLEKYDVIHAQDNISGRALWRVKPAHVPLVVTLHSYWSERIPYINLLKSCGAKSSNLTIAPSQWLKNKLVSNHRVPADHITVIPNGIDVSRFRLDTTAPVTKSPGEKKILICTARLSSEKGHKYLLDALAKLKRVRSDWECWLVGDGPLRYKLKQQCKKLRLYHHVRFLGSRKDVPQLLQRADIFVLASVKDIFPYAVIEAQVAGKPVVVSSAGGIPEMVKHGITGLLSPVAQSNAMYENLKQLLQNTSLRASLAENGQKTAIEQWSVENMVKRLEDVYHNVTNERGNSYYRPKPQGTDE
ncbi:glycosyltransferase family 4 protein [Brevibacillus sp. H7]|uniref:glycosyltransferase family 4 protein n=1 Tax=Brevibacillus sp. H7 TaxID=3349138 RepID=UPI0038213F6E